MAKRCDITGKGVMSGNNVSHAVNRTRRRFLPNLQKMSLISDILKQSISLKIAISTMRTIDARGGLDTYLMNTPDRALSLQARKLKKRIAARSAAIGKLDTSNSAIAS